MVDQHDIARAQPAGAAQLSDFGPAHQNPAQFRFGIEIIVIGVRVRSGARISYGSDRQIGNQSQSSGRLAYEM